MKKDSRRMSRNQPEYEPRCKLVANAYFNHTKLGYERQPTHRELGRMFDPPVDRRKIGQMIDDAIRLEYVKVRVQYDGNRDPFLETDLYETIRTRSERPLLDPRVIRVAAPLIRPDSTALLPAEFIRREVGVVAARMLRELIENMAQTKEVTIGLSWGKSLKETVDALEPIGELPNGVNVIPLVGGFGGPNADVESATLVANACANLGFGRPYSFPAPGYARSLATQMELLGNRFTQSVVDYFGTADLLVSGIGALDPDATALAFWTAEVLTSTDLSLLGSELHAAGDLSLRFFTPDAEPLSNYLRDSNLRAEVRRVLESVAYPVSASLEDLEAAARSGSRHSVVIGSGRKKAQAFVAALQRYCDGIVTDNVTAREIMRLWRDRYASH